MLGSKASPSSVGAAKSTLTTLVHRFEASADYDPAPGLEKIQAAVLAINFADDELNPPELGSSIVLSNASERAVRPHAC